MKHKIMELKAKEQFVCWINEEKKILSFHFEEGYVRKEFDSRTDFETFIVYTASDYRVQ